MTKTGKIVLLTSSLLLVSAGALWAFRKKKPVIAAKKMVGKIIWPDGADSSEALADDGTSSIKQGSSGRYVEQLQSVLNEIHKGTANINKNCKTIQWGYYTKTSTLPTGDVLPVSGIFDSNTGAVSQFYLNRQEVDIDYLKMIQEKLSKWKSGDRCIYPLSV